MIGIPDFVMNLQATWKRRIEVQNDLGAVEGEWLFETIKTVPCFKADERGGLAEESKSEPNRKEYTVFADYDDFQEGDTLTIGDDDFEITSVRNPASLNHHVEMTVTRRRDGNL